MKQLSIFLEDKSGTIYRLLNLLKGGGIQIIASTVADTADNAIYRIICDNPEKAYLILSDAGMTVNLIDVNVIELDDEPGRAAEALAPLTEKGVNIAYLYSFLLKGKGMLVYKVR